MHPALYLSLYKFEDAKDIANSYTNMNKPTYHFLGLELNIKDLKRYVDAWQLIEDFFNINCLGLEKAVFNAEIELKEMKANKVTTFCHRFSDEPYKRKTLSESIDMMKEVLEFKRIQALPTLKYQLDRPTFPLYDPKTNQIYSVEEFQQADIYIHNKLKCQILKVKNSIGFSPTVIVGNNHHTGKAYEEHCNEVVYLIEHEHLAPTPIDMFNLSLMQGYSIHIDTKEVGHV